MSKLILIKHASPLKDPTKPARQWKLSDEGRAAAERLAERLRQLKIDIIVSSEEPKAQETAGIIAEALGKRVETASDLHEHDRDNVPVMPTREFISSIAQFFKERTRLVLGRETAQQAMSRFKRAVDSVVESQPDQNVAVVTHGTVLALFAAEYLGEDPFQLWRRLGLPSYIVLDDRTVVEVVDTV